MAYPEGLLKTRAVIRPGEYAVIPPEGRVRNVIPGIEGCNMSIIASPKLRVLCSMWAPHCPEGARSPPLPKSRAWRPFYMSWMALAR